MTTKANPTEIEVRNSKGEVIHSYQASEEEVRAFPILMAARNKLKAGDPMGAFESLVQVCHTTNTNVMQVIDQAKEKYEEDQKKLSENEKKNKECFLSQQGRSDVLREAYSDGSSMLCCYCNALVKKDRYKIHVSNWCPAIKHDSDSE